jgi:hypothetical protein
MLGVLGLNDRLSGVEPHLLLLAGGNGDLYPFKTHRDNLTMSRTRTRTCPSVNRRGTPNRLGPPYLPSPERSGQGS